jgi:hypothetical protein
MHGGNSITYAQETLQHCCQKGKPRESMIPFLASLSLVLKLLCRASHAKILHFLGAREVKISPFPKHVVPPKIKAK